MGKFPRFFRTGDEDNVFVKVDADFEKDEVFGVTASGVPYPPLKAEVEGTPISEEDFLKAENSASASLGKFPIFVDVSEPGGRPLVVKIFRDQEGIKGIDSDGDRYNPAKADTEGSLATEEDFIRASSLSDDKRPTFALDEDGVVFKTFFDSKEGVFKAELPSGRIVSTRSVDDNSVIKDDGSPVTEEDFVRAKNAFLASNR